MNRPHIRSWHHAPARTIAPIAEAKTKERPIADPRLNTFSQKALHLNHPLRRRDRHLRTPHPGCELTQNYGHYYIEMVENIAAWLRSARVSAPRCTQVFSSEVDTGSREENALDQNHRATLLTLSEAKRI